MLPWWTDYQKSTWGDCGWIAPQNLSCHLVSAELLWESCLGNKIQDPRQEKKCGCQVSRPTGSPLGLNKSTCEELERVKKRSGGGGRGHPSFPCALLFQKKRSREPVGRLVPGICQDEEALLRSSCHWPNKLHLTVVQCSFGQMKTSQVQPVVAFCSSGKFCQRLALNRNPEDDTRLLKTQFDIIKIFREVVDSCESTRLIESYQNPPRVGSKWSK